MEKSGKTNILFWVIIAVAAYFLWQSGFLQGIVGGGANVPISGAPSDFKTTVTLNTYDALTTTPTAANVSYYVFKKSGEFVKTGTTSSGTASFDLQWGGEYTLISYYDATTPGGAADYLQEKVDFTSDSGEGSIKTINMKLYREGTISLSDARDPIDLNANISTALGATSDVEVLWKVNRTNSAVKNPILVIDVNQTCVKDVVVTGMTQLTGCGNRFTTSSGRKKICFLYSGIITSANGVQSSKGTVKFDTATACGAGGGTSDKMDFQMADQQTFLDADYITAGISALNEGFENNDNTNIGEVDTNTKSIGFAG